VILSNLAKYSTTRNIARGLSATAELLVLFVLVMFQVCVAAAGERWRRETSVHHSSRWLLCASHILYCNECTTSRPPALQIFNKTLASTFYRDDNTLYCLYVFVTPVDCVKTAKIKKNNLERV